jgi:hypothetical protein
MKKTYKIETKCPAINSLNLQPMIDRISDPDDELTYSSGWPRDVAETIAEQYKAFLWIAKLHPDKILIPFREVDEFWHQHILHTEQYVSDCQAIFGKYRHHRPHKQKTEDDRLFYEKHSQETLEILMKEFPDIE